MKNFEENKQAYKNFFIGGSLDLAVKQLDEYFDSGVWCSEAVDLLVSATINALNANVMIFQCYQDHVQTVTYTKPHAVKTFHLVFHHDHYQAVLLSQKMDSLTQMHVMQIEDEEANADVSSISTANTSYSAIMKRGTVETQGNEEKNIQNDSLSASSSASSSVWVHVSRGDKTKKRFVSILKPVEKIAAKSLPSTPPGATFVGQDNVTKNKKRKPHSPLKGTPTPTPTEVTFELRYPYSQTQCDVVDLTTPQKKKLVTEAGPIIVEDYTEADPQYFVPDTQDDRNEDATTVDVSTIPDSQMDKGDGHNDDEESFLSQESHVFRPSDFQVNKKRITTSQDIDDDMCSSDENDSTLLSSNASSMSSSASLQTMMGKGRKFHDEWFDDVVPQHVEFIPKDIDGQCAYEVPCDSGNYMEKAGDQRWFKMTTSKKVIFNGKRVIIKNGWCTGSFICMRDRCPFYQTSGERNQTNFTLVSKDLRKCYTCGKNAERKKCDAFKRIRFHIDEGHAFVFHIGKHTCHLSLPRKERRESLVKLFKDRGLRATVPPKQMAIDEIISRIEDEDVDGAIVSAELFADLAQVSQAQKEVVQSSCGVADSHSIDALVAVKRKTDAMDKFLIYQFGIQGMNVVHSESEDYVFKTLLQTLQIGLRMDIDKDERNPMQEELVFIDGKYGRVQGFVSLGMWTYHPASRCVIRLASMEVRTEKTRSIALFLNLFNKALSDVVGELYLFNPGGIVCDNAGAMENAVRNVLGHKFMHEG